MLLIFVITSLRKSLGRAVCLRGCLARASGLELSPTKVSSLRPPATALSFIEGLESHARLFCLHQFRGTLQSSKPDQHVLLVDGPVRTIQHSFRCAHASRVLCVPVHHDLEQ